MQNSMRSEFEKLYPTMFGGIASLVYCLLWSNKPLPDSLENIFSTTASLSSIAVGFLTTAKSILFAITNSFIVKQLKNTHSYTQLINYFIFAIRWSFLLALLSLLGLIIIDKKKENGWQEISFFASWFFSLVASGASAYRVIDLFADILRAEGKKTN